MGVVHPDTGVRTVTMIPGDGIGPELMLCVKRAFEAGRVPVVFEEVDVVPELDLTGKAITPLEAIESIERNKVAIKGPLRTPIGKGFVSNTVALRRHFGLFANVRPCRTLKGLATPYRNIDVTIIRESTQGEYSGIEHEVVDGVVQSIKLVTRDASLNVARYAFEFARRNGKQCVTAVHKANIMKQSDGLFLDSCREVAEAFPDIGYKEITLDKCCLNIVKGDTRQFELLVLPNLYGDILSDVCAGMVGGLGVAPSGNFGYGGIATFEAVHGTAPDVACKDKANPTASLLSACMMLRYIGLDGHASRLERAVLEVLGGKEEKDGGEEEGSMVEGRKQKKKIVLEDMGGRDRQSEYMEMLCGILESQEGREGE
eukprot:Nk52_evm3s346 gene=Nk52_evmTU3s346